MNTPKLILAECRNWFEDVHFVIKNCTENCTAKLLTTIKVENYFWK